MSARASAASKDRVASPAQTSKGPDALRAGRAASARDAVGDAGNQLVQQLFASGVIRANLKVGGADDPEERDADALAQQVVGDGGTCACGGHGGADCHCGGHATQQIRRKPDGSQPRPGAALGGNLALSGGRSLRSSERSFFEPRLGADLSGVRLHSGEQAGGAAAAIAARAFTFRDDVVFGAGELNFESAEGRLLMAHELAHVALNHTGVRRRTDMDAEVAAERADRRRREAEERERRHQGWVSGVQGQFGRDLGNQSGTAGEERSRIDLALTAQRGAAIDAAAAGRGWLQQALTDQGYAGPALAEVKEHWADALVAAETVKLGTSRGDVNPESRVAALEAIPTFYDAASQFTQAAEQAHTAHANAENTRRDAQYRANLAEWQERARANRASQGPIGEPGERGARAAMAISLGPAPEPPTPLHPPPSISGQVAPARARVYDADDTAQWDAVATDLQRIANGLTTLVVATLPEDHDVRMAIQHLEALDTRLETLEREHPLAVRIPAVFYPNDRTIERPDENGQTRVAPEAIPWQFYLIATGVTSNDQPARSGGQWILRDLTSAQGFHNDTPTSDFDALRLQQGDAVDPPLSLFSELNSRIRFPEGRLYFTLPTHTSYVLETTEPWSLSDFLTAVGIGLAAIAITASLIATGGASAPAAVAFYAGLGAAAAGIGSSLANLHERSEQGILTSADVDAAMVSIAIDLVTAASMGLGRLVTVPGAAARIGLTGERFIALQRVTQVARAGALAGDAYQAWSFSSGVLSALRAIDAQPGLSDEERNQQRAQVVRRALLTGALLTIAIRGDIHDFQSGRAIRATHIDEHGVIHAADPGAPREHADGPDAGTAAGHVSPHAEVSSSVHGDAQRAGASLAIGPQTHAVAAAGTGPHRSFYFCSDLCGPIIDRLSAVLSALPRDHPFRPAVQDMLNRARAATRRLRAGELTQQEADTIANELTDRVGRLSADSEHFGALMNTDPALLAAHAPTIRQRLAEALRRQADLVSGPAERQAASRTGRGRDPLAEPDTRSPLETDILGGFDTSLRDRPGGGRQPLRFDTGNFSHTHAEALVPGLPRGLSKEVPVTLPDGNVGRADRVRFVYDGDGDRIGAHVFEVKPNTQTNIDAGNRQVQQYVEGLRNEIQEALRVKGKAPPSQGPNGEALFSGQVVTYNYAEMLAVLRAIRGRSRDAARMAEYEAIARQVFATSAAR